MHLQKAKLKGKQGEKILLIPMGLEWLLIFKFISDLTISIVQIPTVSELSKFSSKNHALLLSTIKYKIFMNTQEL